MKIKYSNIGKLKNLTAKEMDLLLYMVRRQNQITGCVKGVYYRDVMEQEGMCRQSFYNALRGLRNKGIITYERVEDMYYNVCILENAVPDAAARREGYAKLKRKAFYMDTFRALKAHEKYMLFEFMKGTHENGHSIQLRTENLYKKFMELLGVTKRVIRSYLHSLKQFFTICVKDGKYFITYRHSIFSDKVPDERSEEAWHLQHLVRKECWKYHIAFKEAEIKDTAALIVQYRESCGLTAEEAIDHVLDCIGRSVEGHKRKERCLRPKFVHMLVRQKLGLDRYRPRKEPESAAKTDAEEQTSSFTGTGNKFHNFTQRSYDDDFLKELEKQLLADQSRPGYDPA